MYIESIRLNNFRNYELLEMNFDQGTNILYGDNAQGKTNILEAVYLAGTSKSHKGSKDREMIRFENEESHIRMMVKKGDLSYKIDMHLRKNKAKGVAINGLPIRKARELLGVVNLVFFSPEDLNIIKDGPGERRRFLDSELCQLDGVYITELASYNHIVNQRNRLLKDCYMNPGLKSTLDIWDMQMADYGKKIIEKREEFVEELNELAKENIHAACDKLMDILSNYQGYRKCTLILVFDAYKVEGHVEEIIPYHNIYVVYTKEAETADQYIEKTVHRIGRQYQVTVATSDGLEQVIIMGQGAHRISAQGLKKEIEDTEKTAREEWHQRRQSSKTYLFDHMSEEMQEQMEKIRLGENK